jgi:hypothetical protein
VLLFVPDQPTRQQMRLNQDLEAIADTKNRKALFGKPNDRFGGRGLCGDRSAAQVISVGKSSRQYNRVNFFEIVIIMPKRNWYATGKPDGSMGISVI